MENDWETDFEWLQVRHQLKDNFGFDKLPELNSILILVGIQESGIIQETYTKEQKQDLMHVAVCSLLYEYYSYTGRDADGWPHFKQINHLDKKGVGNQESLLKQKIITYFNSSKEEE